MKEARLPDEYLNGNAEAFLEEDFADNALVYASPQLMLFGAREDGWHTDGGASLLHAAVTLFGCRTLKVKLGAASAPTSAESSTPPEGAHISSLQQRPGSFYMGNLCALSHNVVHQDDKEGGLSDGEGGQQVQIAVMLRSDYFRLARARRINSTPSPAEVYRIVNTETAKHLSEYPLYLPDLAAVLAEAR